MTPKLKEALDRLVAASKKEFPWNVRLTLMNEAVIAMCEDQYQMHVRIADQMEDLGRQLAAIRQQTALIRTNVEEKL